jgi:hypothetical protein
MVETRSKNKVLKTSIPPKKVKIKEDVKQDDDKIEIVNIKKEKQPNNSKKYDELMKTMKIDETFTRPITKKPKFDRVKNFIHPEEDYNYACDLLMLPTTTKGFKYLLTFIDLWSDEVEAEPLKNKQSSSILRAATNIFKRKILNKPKASIRTDEGTEFKGEFHKYLYDQSILHSVALPNRHKQNGAIENVNKLLGRIIMNYLLLKEEELEKEYTEWTDLFPKLIVELNKIRKRPNKDPYAPRIAPKMSMIQQQKFNVGDIVYRKLDTPKDSFNNYQRTNPKFRMGDKRWDDKEPKKIKSIQYYPNNVRYVLEGIDNVAYTQDELMLAKEKEAKFAVKKILDRRSRNKQIEYLIHFKKELKKNASWQPKQNLIEDGLEKELEEFDKNFSKLKKKKKT